MICVACTRSIPDDFVHVMKGVGHYYTGVGSACMASRERQRGGGRDGNWGGRHVAAARS